MKRILFVAAEAAPFAKTGGLGDVIGSLPVELVKNGVDARVIMPWYRDIPDALKAKAEPVAECTVRMGWRKQHAIIWQLQYDGVVFYFVDQAYYFDRSGYYGYFDDAERFAFFSQAVLSVLPKLDFSPDIIHANDWHTALVPLYLEHFYRHEEFFEDIKTVFTVHNLAYQGVFSPAIIEDVLGLDWGYFTNDKLEFNNAVNLMKGGILYAHAVTTVSESYASEIQTPQFGEGLDGVLRACQGKLAGIINGIDYDKYNPLTDKALPFIFDKGALFSRRTKNKEWLLENMGMDKDSAAPLLGVVSRMVAAKGFDLLCEVIPDLLKSGARIVILGTGEHGYEAYLRYLAEGNREVMAVVTQFDDRLSRIIYGGSDIFLMPSVFEPCGTSQMIAMRYGAIPLVHETGGLKDSVQSYNKFTKQGTGFSFTEMFPDSFLQVYKEALSVYEDKKAWEKLMVQAMDVDISWKASVQKYIDLYERLGGKG